MITITATGDTTLHTAGKYCPEDILVKVPSGNSGSGSGGVSVDTCTLRVIGAGPCCVVYMSADSTGKVHTQISQTAAVHSGLSVVCGSHISIIGNTMVATAGTISANGAELYLQKNWGAIFEITAAAGENANISIMMDS